MFPELRNRRVLLYLGRIHKKKGIDLLLRALARVSPIEHNLHVLVCGSGDSSYVQAMKNLAAQVGVSDRVTWAGLTLGAAKWAAFRIAELFVLPSHQENFGIAVVESLACGTPVLISNKVNIFRQIQARHAGLICDDSETDLVASLANWLSLPEKVREEMRSNAQNCFRQYYSAHAAAAKLRTCIETAVAAA
jgi:glycosyltransferase involved in cell wall biosynthesis